MPGGVYLRADVRGVWVPDRREPGRFAPGSAIQRVAKVSRLRLIIEDGRGKGGRLVENREFLRFSVHWGFRILDGRTGRSGAVFVGFRHASEGRTYPRSAPPLCQQARDTNGIGHWDDPSLADDAFRHAPTRAS